MNSGLVKYQRLLNLDLPPGQSAFLWGARKTGKSTYLHAHFPSAVYYDLLKSDLYLRFSKEPHLLREEILALPDHCLRSPIIIDEVQKIPQLLNEVHWLIENSQAYFVLCGSSARKVKHHGINLLGGRAWRYTFYPLVYPEITDFNLLQALNTGLVPAHYVSVSPKRSLKAYVQDYLTHEIQAEGLTRNLPAFARFLDALSFGHGALVNFSNIARECGVDAKTVKEYYQILVDTLLGYFIYPFKKRYQRDIITATPKFYLFDVGVVNSLSKRSVGALKGIEAGNAFEHFILMELMAYRGIYDLDFEITFWRTKTGLEVDFILGNAEVALEIKMSDNVQGPDFKGLQAFQEEYQPKRSYVICLVPRERKWVSKTGVEIHIVPWEAFLKKLWAKEIIE